MWLIIGSFRSYFCRAGGRPLYERCAKEGLAHFVGWMKATLRLNYRIEDNADGATLRKLLQRLRHGEVNAADIEQLNSRVAGAPGVPKLEDLGDYQVLAIRHDVIEHIVVPLVRRLARSAAQQLVMWHAEDSTATLRTVDCTAPNLQPTGFFYRGMRAVASSSVCTDKGVVNNAELELLSLTLDERERPLPSPESEPVVVLKYLPACVYVRAHGRDAVAVVPIERPSRMKKMRRQLPYRPAAVITDFCAQGATFDADRRVVVDICRPPTGSLCFHSLYVTLSRFRRWSQVVLLRAILSGEHQPLKRAVDVAFFVKASVPPINVVLAQWWIEHPDAIFGASHSDLETLEAVMTRRTADAGKAFAKATRALRMHVRVPV